MTHASLSLEQIQASSRLIDEITAGRIVPAGDAVVALLVAWRADCLPDPSPQSSAAGLAKNTRLGGAHHEGDTTVHDARRDEVTAMRQRATLHRPQERPQVHPDYRSLLAAPLDTVGHDIDTSLAVAVIAAGVATVLAIIFCFLVAVL